MDFAGPARFDPGSQKSSRHRNRRSAGIATLALLCFAIPALYHAGPAAGATIADSNPAGATSTIVLRGTIASGDGDRLRAILQADFLANGRRLAALFVDSQGGAILEAAYIARIVHQIDVPVVVDKGDFCESACFLILAAARHRLIDSAAIIAVHSTSNTAPQRDRSAEDTISFRDTVGLARLYHDYGVPDAIIVKMIATVPPGLYRLNRAEILSLTDQDNE